MVVPLPLRLSSAAMCLAMWFKAALDAAYAAKPSSMSRNSVADPESLEMKTMVPMERLAARRRCAQMIGPTVFVCKCKAKSS